jgi:signal transduction histidine kinase
MMRAWLIPPLHTDLAIPNETSPDLFLAREQIMTGLLRVVALIGLLALVVAAVPLALLGFSQLVLIYMLLVVLTWVLALLRQLSYRLRGSLVVLSLYALSLTEMLAFGYSEDAHIWLAACALFTVVFFELRAGSFMLGLSLLTLLTMGWQLSTGSFTVFAYPVRNVTLPEVLSSCANFLLVIGALQVGITMLMRNLARALQRERQARQQLEHERNLLEQRVAERTQELSTMHEAALAASSAYIAEQTRVEQALQSSLAELNAQNADLEAFAHTVAHDLKDPLCRVISVSQLIKMSNQELPPAELEKQLDWIVDAGQKMLSIIDELLLLARVRSKDSPQYTVLDSEQIVGDAEWRLEALFGEYGATIVLPDVWPRAIGHSPWVEAIWVNYLSNALKYGGRPPQIVVGAERKATGMVHFWVQDNGPGLSAEQQAQLFEPFKRLHTERASGHGLGLSIVQQIAERLGGTAWVESEVGKGSRFSFSLPAAE